MTTLKVQIDLDVKEKATMSSMKNLNDIEYVKEKVIPQYEELTSWFAQKYVKELTKGKVTESKDVKYDFIIKTEKEFTKEEIEEIEKESGIKTKERIKEELNGVNDVIINIEAEE